ncbi:MAG TPA: SpoIIE family protein phosphatase [Kineosporiaceae bacterium]|nr:SpoIIE family protein phosphatase [Kineosporiaceae bacterium]
MTGPGIDDVRLPERPERPQTRINLVGALAATALAALALVLALVTELSPPYELAIAFLVAIPVLGTVAFPIVATRARAEHDEALGWFAAGLAVSVFAAALQSLSFPGVLADGGPFHTAQPGGALLLLLMHAAPALAVLAAAAGVPGRARRWFVGIGVGVALACAGGLVPAPQLVFHGGRFTTALVVAELVVSWLLAVAAVLWVRDLGPSVTALRAWAGVALSLFGYDLLLSAIAAQRFSSIWWASLALRTASYAVLAGGALAAVLAQLGRLEQYTDRELDRSDERLRGSLAVTDRLLDTAQRFSGAVTAADVGSVVIAASLSLTGLERGCVVVDGDKDHDRAHDRPHDSGSDSGSDSGGDSGGDSGSDSGSDSSNASGNDYGRSTRHGWRHIEVVAAVGYDEESLDVLARSVPEACLPGARVLRTGRPVFSTTRRPPQTDYPDIAQLPVHATTQAIAVLPLTAAGQVVGVLAVSGSGLREFDATEREVLGALAAQAGQALQRALLYERQLRMAELLQRGLLPQRLPAVPGIAMAARYAPGAEGLRVGGDWYDAIPVPGNRLALVIGDVMGKGVDAATRMAQVRGAVRVLAAVDPEPAAVAAGLDLMASELAEDQIVTLVYLLLDPATGQGSVARLGHLPPLLVPPRGEPRVLDGAGSPPLGVPGASREQASLVVEPGAVLILFTDGLVEERHTGLDVGLRALTAASRQLADGLDVEEFADAVLGLGATGGERPDDVCVLVVRRDPIGGVPVEGSPLDAAMTLPAGPASGAAARRFVQRTLAGVRPDPERLDTLVLLCSELVTNAVLHAAGPSQVRLRLRDGRVRLEVHDPSPQVPTTVLAGPEATNGRGMMLVDALADAWGVDPGDGLPDVGKTVWVEVAL